MSMQTVTINGYGVDLDSDNFEFDKKLNQVFEEITTNQIDYDECNIGDVSLYYNSNTGNFTMLLVIENAPIVMKHKKPIKVYTEDEAKQALKSAWKAVVNYARKYYKLTNQEYNELLDEVNIYIDHYADYSEDEWSDVY